MEVTTAAAMAGILGVLIGAAGVLAFRFSESEQRGEPDSVDADMLRGVAELLGVLRSAAVVVDLADGVVKASPAAYAFGLVRGHDVVHAPLVEMVRAVREDGVIRERDLDLPRGPLGQARLFVHVRVAPLGPLFVILLVDDRTESRRLEEVRRDFVINVSHELKTPVGAIALLAETMAEAADDPDAVRRFSARMKTESARLSALVQEIIDLSRLQVAQGLEQPEIVDLDDVIAEAIDRSSTAAEERRIDIHCGPASHAQVYGDRELLVTAVRNLIDNGIRYSDSGTRVAIGVKLDNRLAEIAVSDQGIGIAAKDLDRVFERFFRVDPARSRQTGGTGLGLSIVKHVAANHGGDVVVWSQPGQGSTFTLRLPTAAGERGTLSADGDSSDDSRTSDDQTPPPTKPTPPPAAPTGHRPDLGARR